MPPEVSKRVLAEVSARLKAEREQDADAWDYVRANRTKEPPTPLTADDETVLRKFKADFDGGMLRWLAEENPWILNGDGQPDDAKVLACLKARPPGEKRKLYQIILEETPEPPIPLTPEENKVLDKCLKAGYLPGLPPKGEGPYRASGIWYTKEERADPKGLWNAMRPFLTTERREAIDQLKADPETYQLFLRSTRLPVECPGCGKAIHPAKRRHSCGWRTS